MTPLTALLAERGISQGELVRRTGLAGKTVSNAYQTWPQLWVHIVAVSVANGLL